MPAPTGAMGEGWTDHVSVVTVGTVAYQPASGDAYCLTGAWSSSRNAETNREDDTMNMTVRFTDVTTRALLRADRSKWDYMRKMRFWADNSDWIELLNSAGTTEYLAISVVNWVDDAHVLSDRVQINTGAATSFQPASGDEWVHNEVAWSVLTGTHPNRTRDCQVQLGDGTNWPGTRQGQSSQDNNMRPLELHTTNTDYLRILSQAASNSQAGHSTLRVKD